jgi:uncharacterized membrane protein
MKKTNEKKQQLVFGYGLPIICAFFSWRQYVLHDGFTPLSIILISVGIFVFILTLFNAPLLKFIFNYWMKAAKIIGSILTMLILTVVYSLIITPIAFCLRISGKDYMKRKWNKDAPTYWIAHVSDNDNKAL